MLRTITAGATLAVASLVGFAGFTSAAGAETTTVAGQATVSAKVPNPLKCVGAADHKTAQGLRLQALNADLSALNARLAVAQSTNNAKAVERIQAHIAKVNERIAKVQANQAKVAAKCP